MNLQPLDFRILKDAIIRGGSAMTNGGGKHPRKKTTRKPAKPGKKSLAGQAGQKRPEHPPRPEKPRS
jgi:hypothetical protein